MHRGRHTIGWVALAVVVHLASLPGLAALHAGSHLNRGPALESAFAECVAQEASAHSRHWDRTRPQTALDCEVCLNLNSLQKRHWRSASITIAPPGDVDFRAPAAPARVRSALNSAPPRNKSPPVFA